ncbi:MAG: hypothetical protein BGO29_15530 [Bacteroidales bacterium 36-12]|nr:MAG: hypothetical protein BGO29_15530 [Bacteroidales bacterium 36-12]
MSALFNPQEVGKGIADFGFLIIAGSVYIVYSATLFYFFIKWFVRIINNIINKQQSMLAEMLQLQKEQKEILQQIVTKLKNAA